MQPTHLLRIPVLLFVLTLCAGPRVSAQVGIGTTTPDASAQLDISSTSKGLLPPRMGTAHMNGIASPATAPLIYGDFAADSLRINGSLNVNGNYTFPKTAGTAGYLMQTDGAGQTSWINPASLTAAETDPQVSSVNTNSVPKWNGTTLTDGIITDNGSAVGIGTTGTPAERLEVTGNIRASDTVKATRLKLIAGASNGYLLTSDASGNAKWTAASSAIATTHTLALSGNTLTSTVNGVAATSSAVATNALSLSGTSITSTVNGVSSAALNLSTAVTAAETDPQVSSSITNRYPYWNGTTLTDGYIYNNNGNVGIGVANAALPLEVAGTTRFSSSTNADIQLNSGSRPTIYPNGPNVPTNLDVQLRSAGSGALLLNADNTGNMLAVAGGGSLMMGSGVPAARLDVAGNFKLGSDGSVLTSVIKSTYSASTASIAANAAVTYTITVTGATTGASVSVSPNADMPNGVYIASARVSSANTVSLKIYNATGASISLAAITNYYITVIN